MPAWRAILVPSMATVRGRCVSEEYYDEEIAPALRDVASKCEAWGMSIVAMVEWEPGETGSTRALAAGRGFGMELVQAAVSAQGNVDALVFAIMRHAREHGHASIILKQLGVPLTPPVGTGDGNAAGNPT